MRSAASMRYLRCSWRSGLLASLLVAHCAACSARLWRRVRCQKWLSVNSDWHCACEIQGEFANTFYQRRLAKNLEKTTITIAKHLGKRQQGIADFRCPTTKGIQGAIFERRKAYLGSLHALFQASLLITARSGLQSCSWVVLLTAKRADLPRAASICTEVVYMLKAESFAVRSELHGQVAHRFGGRKCWCSLAAA